ncbi:MAG: hypothetical protein JXM70_10015 [Pirellulales bacterium]|nr:hypothetical protein [Pirellulales bacterium]
MHSKSSAEPSRSLVPCVVIKFTAIAACCGAFCIDQSRGESAATDCGLYPKAYGVLAGERLMYPVDMSDWPVKIDNTRQLFVDDYLVASMENITRRMHQPQRHPANPVLRLREKPWEQSFGHALYVLRDRNSGKYRMWYNLRHRIPAENGLQYRGPMCYAESNDGINWVKPNLDIFKYNGSTNNNITLPQGSIEGLFYEPQEPDKSRRYKALVWHDPKDQKEYAPREGFYLYWSPDGLHWQGDNRRCIIPNGQGGNFPASPCTGVGDTTNFRWDHKLKKYVSNVKILFRNPSTLRTVGFCESDDLIHWTRPRMAMHRDALDESDTQMYEHITFPYESMWLGFVRAMHTERKGWKQVEVEMSASRDGRHWTRICRGQRFMHINKDDSWDADYLIPGRPGEPLLVDGKLRFYYWGTRQSRERDGKGNRYDMHVGLATLRRDGFVSLTAMNAPGVIVTRPLSFKGKRLFVNAEVQDGGSIKIGLLNAEGKVHPGYAPDECLPITKGEVTIPVKWTNTGEFTLPADKHARVRFELKKAEVYAFWFE